jgi:hypothetical protein
MYYQDYAMTIEPTRFSVIAQQHLASQVLEDQLLEPVFGEHNDLPPWHPKPHGWQVSRGA